jgi:hypothetical protein
MGQVAGYAASFFFLWAFFATAFAWHWNRKAERFRTELSSSELVAGCRLHDLERMQERYVTLLAELSGVKQNLVLASAGDEKARPVKARSSAEVRRLVEEANLKQVQVAEGS